MNSSSKVRGIGILVFIGVLILSGNDALASAKNQAKRKPSKARAVDTRRAPIADLKGLQKNATKLIKDLQKNNLTKSVARKIENELRAVEKTRIQAVRIAEKLERHQKTLQKLQTELFSKMNDLSQEQTLKLQMLMDKQQQFQQTLSNIMKVFHDTQKSIIQNMK